VNNRITLVTYNLAKEGCITYNEKSGVFFKGREYLLFTVSFELENNKFSEVKIPVQMIPILKPMQPVSNL